MSGRDRALNSDNVDKLPALFVVALMTTIIPMNFEIYGLLLTASRVVLIFIAPYLFVRLLSGAYGKISHTDILFGLFLMWFAIAVLVQTPGRFVTFVGSNLIIMGGGYLLGRCCVRSPDAFRKMIILYGLLVIASLPFALYEMKTSVMPIARWIEQIPGINSSTDVEYPSRNNLERVQFVFVHPIHYGLFSTFIFGMVAIGLRGVVSKPIRIVWATGIAFCCFTSGSSGPFTGILIVIALMIYDVTMKGRWKLLIWTSIVLYIIVDLLSNRPAYFIVIESVAFNPGTAYGRRIILETGISQIWRTPIFGTPNPLPLPHWMTGSLDNYWLLVAVAYGLPAFIFLMGAYVLTLVRVSKADLRADPNLGALRKGWMIGTIGSMFSLATVAVWSELVTLTFLVFGSGVWLMEARVKDAAEDEAPEKTASRAPVFTRFPDTSENALRFSSET